MNTNLIPASIVQEIGISYADARKAVESMNLIDGFLFDSSIENEEDAKVVIGAMTLLMQGIFTMRQVQF